MRRKYFFLFSFLFIFTPIASSLKAQTIWTDRVYSPLVKSVRFEAGGVDFTIPIIKLESSEKLILKFDILSEEPQQLNYTIIHCNSDWTQSDLRPQEYIEGFEQGYIENYSHSINTIEHYIHYYQEFPSSMMRFLVSGNYIIKIYADDNPDKVIMVRRFMIYEDASTIRTAQMMAREPQYKRTKQEIDVFLSPKSSMSFADPNRYLKVFVQQNGRRDNVSQLKLRQYRGNELEYSFDNSNIFDAGNEFRNFDFTSLRIRSMNVSNFDFIDGENIVKLKPIADRSKLTYTTQGDLDGHYYIRNDRRDDFDLESDYAWVVFYLPMQIRLDGSFYVWGELSDWYCTEQNKMTYDKRFGAYTASLYLKQGFYDYMIMFMPSGSMEYSLGVMEGNHSETNNTYHIYVYYRKPGNSYDSLIGYYSTKIN